MAIEYEKKRGHSDFVPEIVADFLARWPGAVPPSKKTIKRQAEKLEHFNTLHNLNSKVTFHDLTVSQLTFC